ncbi:MAG: folate-binding protein [Opitutaceae bacterium]
MPINISTSPAVFQWQPAAWLRVCGSDAANFLQGQFTNDLRGLAAVGVGERPRAVYGLWLSVKGKVVADSFVVRGAEVNEFWLGSYFSPAAMIRERLDGHIIADDVLIEDQTADWRGLSVLGAGAGAVVERLKPKGCFVFSGRRTRAGGWECVFPAGAFPAGVNLDDAMGSLDAESVERLRIREGIPAIPTDVGPSDLPNEAGLETEAISYTKGCYLGQEVMARLKSMGQVRRRLLRVRGGDAQWPAIPTAIFVGSRQVGELRSAIRDGDRGWIGLAMLSLVHLAPEAALSFSLGSSAQLLLVDTP